MSPRTELHDADPVVAVVDCGPDDPPRLARLRAALPTRLAHGAPAPGEIAERAAGAAVLATLYTYTRIDDAVLERLPALRLVITRTAGYSHIDVAAAERRGIAVAAVPSAATIAVAEFTLAALLALRRDLVAAAASTRAGGWPFTGFRGRDLAGSTLGVVGLGSIGQRVAQLGGALGMEVLGWSRTSRRLPGVRQVPLDELLAGADAVSVNVASTPDTRRLLDRRRLGSMRRGAVLVNTARGEVLDLDALCDLLRSGHLAGALLDVVDDEPPAPAVLRALADVPNLMLTPHVSWHTEETLTRQFDGLTDTILGFCAGAPVELVTRARDELGAGRPR